LSVNASLEEFRSTDVAAVPPFTASAVPCVRLLVSLSLTVTAFEYVPEIVSPAASFTAMPTVCGEPNAVFAAPEGSDVIVKLAGTPAKMALSVFVVPAVTAKSDVCVESTLPPVLFAEKDWIVKLSVPGGTLGPLTVQPELHEPDVMLLVVLATPPTGVEPFTVLSVISTDNVLGETYEIVRKPFALLDDGLAGIAILKLTGTRSDGVCAVAGGIDAVAPPPPHPESVHSTKKLIRINRSSRAPPCLGRLLPQVLHSV
jgi:hypothetical protein